MIVYPAAGYMAMAIEAAKQVTQDRYPDARISGYRIRNIAFKKALFITSDSGSMGTELVLTFHSSETRGAYRFEISSTTDQGLWEEHCDGNIAISFMSDIESEEEVDQYHIVNNHELERLQQVSSSCMQEISKADLYATMETAGNKYGPTFSIIQSTKMTASRSISNIAIPDINKEMPANFSRPHTIHPISLDAVLQTGVFLFEKQMPLGSKLPVLIRELFISAKVNNHPGAKMGIASDLDQLAPDSASFNSTVFKRHQPITLRQS